MNRRPLIVRLIAVILLFAISTQAALAAPSEPNELLVRIWLAAPKADAARLAGAPLTSLALEALPQPYVLARTGEDGAAWLQANGLRFDVLDRDAGSARYVMLDAHGPQVQAESLAAGQMLYADGERELWRLPASAAMPASARAWPLDQPVRLQPRDLPAAPAVVIPIPQVQEIMNQVHLPRLMTYANELSGEVPATINGAPYTITTRYSGEDMDPAPEAAFQSVNYMEERLQRLGLTVSRHTWDSLRPDNLIAEKPGLIPAAGIYIICAHLDSITYADPMVLAPGADDNASGSVAVLMAAELLAPYNFDATLRFVLFTGEEQGLYGSTAYANMVQNQDIRGVLNMDMIAWDTPTTPANMDLHARSTVAGSMALAQVFADVVSAYDIALLPAIYSNGSSFSDHSPFWNVGIPAFLVIENSRSDTGVPSDFNAYYHSNNDRTQYFNQTYFHNMTKASLGAFAHMAGIHTTCYWADLDCDGEVDAIDITTVANRWLTSYGQWNYARVYDANDDNVIDIVDIQTFAAQWGWSTPG